MELKFSIGTGIGIELELNFLMGTGIGIGIQISELTGTETVPSKYLISITYQNKKTKQTQTPMEFIDSCLPCVYVFVKGVRLC